MSTAIGIDLGTTHTALAFVEDGQVKYIHNNAGKLVTPSVVHFAADGTIIVGEEALSRRVSHPLRSIGEIKRFIGRSYDDEKLKRITWPFQVVRGQAGRACVRVDGDLWTPEEISAIILMTMKKLTSKYIEDAKDAVITVPSHFSNVQRQATADAAQLAGFNVLQIINEPTAAALAFCHEFPSPEKRNILVYDLGGGTFDVSIVEVSGTKSRVLATDGDTFLGGIDFDRCIYEEAVGQFKADGIDAPNHDVELMAECERAKKALAKKPAETITYRTQQGNEVEFELSYEIFAEICEHKVEETIRLVNRAIASSKLPKQRIDEIVLVGGSTRLRSVRERLADHFPGRKIRTELDPDLAIVHGAAILAASLKKEQEAEQKSMVPDIQLVDVTPLSLGIKVDDRMSIIIPKNSPLPTRSFQMYIPNDKDNFLIRIEVVEGENDVDFTQLAQFDFYTRPLCLRKTAQVFQVIFDIDESGILHVTPKDPEFFTESHEIISSNITLTEKTKLSKQLKRLTINH